MPEPLRKLHKLEQAMCEIFANQRHFTTEETKWSLPVKPESNLCLSIQIVAFTCQLLFEFSIWVLNFARIYFRGSFISRFFYNHDKRIAHWKRLCLSCQITEFSYSLHVEEKKWTIAGLPFLWCCQWHFVSNSTTTNTKHVGCSSRVFEQFTEYKQRCYNNTRCLSTILVKKMDRALEEGHFVQVYSTFTPLLT